MPKTKLYGETINGYSIEKARKILEQDGTILTEQELNQIVKVLTLLAQQEKHLINKEI